MYATDFSQVGSNIQKHLVAKGFTQQRLADELGISKQVMNKIIKGGFLLRTNISQLRVRMEEKFTCQGMKTQEAKKSYSVPTVF